MKKKTLLTPLNMAFVGAMTALGTVIYFFLPEIPLVPGVGYLKIDLSDIPAILIGSAVHPACGILVEVFKNLIHLFKTTTVGVGELMNIGVGTVVILSLHFMSKLFARVYRKDRWHPLVYFTASATAVVFTILGGWLLNWCLTPLFYSAMGWPLSNDLLIAGVFGSTVLNAVKAAVNLLPFYPLYRAMAKIVARMP